MPQNGNIFETLFVLFYVGSGRSGRLRGLARSAPRGAELPALIRRPSGRLKAPDHLLVKFDQKWSKGVPAMGLLAKIGQFWSILIKIGQIGHCRDSFWPILVKNDHFWSIFDNF